MLLHTLAVERIVVGKHTVSVCRACFKILEFDLVLSKLNRLTSEHAFIVADKCISFSSASFDKSKLVGEVNGKAYVIDADKFVACTYIGLYSRGVNTDFDSPVALHDNVLDVGSVYVLDGIDCILDNTLCVAHVDLEDKVLHIRAILEHIR